MKTLKKLLCTALSLSLVLALAACGGNSSGGDAASGEVPIIGINQYGSHAPWTTAGRLPPGLQEPAWWRAPTIPSTTRTPT